MYFDPGTGSIIIQLLIGLFAMGGTALVVLRKKIAGLFRKGQPADEVESIQADELEEDDDFLEITADDDEGERAED